MEGERDYVVSANLVRSEEVVGTALLGVTFDGPETLNELGEAVLLVQYIWRVPEDFDPSAFVALDGETEGKVRDGDKVKATGVYREEKEGRS